MKLNKEENKKNCDRNQDVIRIEKMDVCETDVELLKKQNRENQTYMHIISDKEDEIIETNLLGNIEILDEHGVPLVGDFNAQNIGSCIEIDSNVINIQENQILKIEYQNGGDIVKAEYIINENVNRGQVENNSVSFTEGVYEEVSYQIDNGDAQQSEGRIILDENFHVSELKETSNSLDSNLKSSLLSPQSEDDTNSETDLTSLTWLHNITNIMSVPNLPTPPVSPKPKKKPSNSNQEDLTININFYKKNGDKKPPFSYATLICMAMGKNGNKMTLSAIYHWIRENFLYYRRAHPSWQVRTCFVF